MATNKNRINAYVDARAFKAFESFCQHWQVSYSRGIELLLHKYLLGDFELKEPVTSNLDLTQEQLDRIAEELEGRLKSVTSNLAIPPSQIDEITAKIKSNLDSVIGNLLATKLPDREKLEKAIALVDEQEAVLGKLETLTAEIESLREKVELQPSKTREPKTEEVPVEKLAQSDKLNDDSSNSRSIKSHEQAIKEIIRLKEQGLSATKIAKELKGKYYTSQEKTNWSHTQVNRILAKN